METLAIAAAWLGGTTLTLSEAGGGLAFGLALAASGLALSLAISGDLVGAGFILASGLAAAGLRLRGGGGDGGLLPPGSTPRLVLSLAVLIAAGFFGANVIIGAGGSTRVAGLAVALLASARLMGTSRRPPALAAAGALALALGVLGGIAPLAAGVAAGLGLLAAAESPKATV